MVTFVLILLIVVGQEADQFGKELTADIEKITITAQERRARMCKNLQRVAKDERTYVPLSTLEKYCGKGAQTDKLYLEQIAKGRNFGST